MSQAYQDKADSDQRGMSPSCLAPYPGSMPPRCTVCVHPKRAEINKALLQSGRSAGSVAEEYGLVRESVRRHLNNHLKISPEAVSEQKNALTIIGYAHELYERANKVLERAEALLGESKAGPGSVQAASASLREVRSSIELLARLVVNGDQEPEHESRNAALDAKIEAALAELVMAELPAGPALDSGVEDAQVIPD